MALYRAFITAVGGGLGIGAMVGLASFAASHCSSCLLRHQLSS
jgi:hypothetical protein